MRLVHRYDVLILIQNRFLKRNRGFLFQFPVVKQLLACPVRLIKAAWGAIRFHQFSPFRARLPNRQIDAWEARLQKNFAGQANCLLAARHSWPLHPSGPVVVPDVRADSFHSAIGPSCFTFEAYGGRLAGSRPRVRA